jgi:hypothetical protein
MDRPLGERLGPRDVNNALSSLVHQGHRPSHLHIFCSRVQTLPQARGVLTQVRSSSHMASQVFECAGTLGPTRGAAQHPLTFGVKTRIIQKPLWRSPYEVTLHPRLVEAPDGARVRSSWRR